MPNLLLLPGSWIAEHRACICKCTSKLHLCLRDLLLQNRSVTTYLCLSSGSEAGNIKHPRQVLSGVSMSHTLEQRLAWSEPIVKIDQPLFACMCILSNMPQGRRIDAGGAYIIAHIKMVSERASVPGANLIGHQRSH